MDLYLLSIENLKQVYDIFDKKSKWISVVPNFLSDTLGLFLFLFFFFLFGSTFGLWKFPGPGIVPAPQQHPELLLRHHWILNPLSHQGTPVDTLGLINSLYTGNILNF